MDDATYVHRQLTGLIEDGSKTMFKGALIKDKPCVF
jgi:hypothetical protein